MDITEAMDINNTSSIMTNQTFLFIIITTVVMPIQNMDSIITTIITIMLLITIIATLKLMKTPNHSIAVVKIHLAISITTE